jgi:hypothetical protein
MTSLVATGTDRQCAASRHLRSGSCSPSVRPTAKSYSVHVDPTSSSAAERASSLSKQLADAADTEHAQQFRYIDAVLGKPPC